MAALPGSRWSSRRASVGRGGRTTSRPAPTCSPSIKAAPSARPHAARRLLTPPLRSAQQHVPSDSFGGRSPERVAADALRTLFTFAAAKIVLAQLEGSGRGGLVSYNKESYDALSSALAAWPAPPPPPSGGAAPPPKKGAVAGDAWLAGLARVHPASARRVAEVREAYAASDFEWDSTQRLAVQGTAEANLRLMRELLFESLAASGGGGGGDGEKDEDGR